MTLLFRFDFWLVASDGTYSTSGHVIVNLKDLNDNAPSISVIFIAPDTDAPNTGKYYPFLVKNNPMNVITEY